MNVSITDRLGEFVQQKVQSGLYNSASEVVREALRFMEERDQINQIKLEALRRDINAGLTSGEPVAMDMNEIIKRGEQRLARKKA